MEFIYSFKISDEIPETKLFKCSDLDYMESKIVQVIYESFIIPADEDYLTARLLAQNGLPRAFYWAASQTIEKYLKAMLLLHGQSVRKSKNHLIKPLFDRASEYFPNLKTFELNIDDNIEIDHEVKKLFEQISIDCFLNDIEQFGSADNRYNSSGIKFNTWYLFLLDKLISEIRLSLSVPDIFESYKKIHPNLINIFKDNNPKFSGNDFTHSTVPSEKFKVTYSLSVTSLDFISKHTNSNHSYVLKWLYKKMKLPYELEQKLKN
ncbi:HEPN domain-containing protein [Colwellia sp. 4_MG-2023]|uniref:HEPN domain-containing protein n=1 Tax=unclassified Colwellia TaxID=196834 RepID=UPI0026E449D1|nr:MULTISPECIES: HEPN domain-containing protein [unclassified Colwellia]MDO6506614.1 HEPN domain-containing protein [Colwellia sp. 5_MG-2023]MDO6555101.1 HEPN domain-containing protein [Colwellia sp. 4_MG-2023]